MRYSKEHKAGARQRLLDSSARHVKQHGFAASGVDALATAAGVTTGSLYKHFDGKSDLFASVIHAELQRTAERFAKIRPGDTDAVEKVIAAYLSLQHVRHPELGCPLPALTAEVARADDSVRAAFDEGLREIHAQLKPIARSSAKAWALIAQSVGAVMIARASLGPKLQRELLDSARVVARSLLIDGQTDR
jgi:TetR/AcrR family transcriptional regulator, transcriptional repressor for nem operon